MPRILLTEDDAALRDFLAWFLRHRGYAVETCSNGAGLLERLVEMEEEPSLMGNFELIISDVRLPGVTGMEILEYHHERSDLPPLLLITAFGDQETHAKAALGGAAILDKPFALEDFLAQIEALAPAFPYNPENGRL